LYSKLSVTASWFVKPTLWREGMSKWRTPPI
jgi:hypothetical protein